MAISDTTTLDSAGCVHDRRVEHAGGFDADAGSGTPNSPDLDAADVTDSGIGASADASRPRWVAACGEVDAGHLEAVIMAAGGLLHSSRYRLITALAAYDSTRQWVFTGAHTCAHWVADRLGVHVGTAREWLRVGHALEALPLVDAAMADGRVNYCAVRALTRVVVDHLDREGELVALAERTRSGDLARVLAAWTLDHDSDGQREERERRDTYVSFRVDPDGMGVISGRLPAIDLGRIQAAVDAAVMQSKTTQAPGPAASADRSHPSLGAQRAHALVGLVTGEPAATDQAGTDQAGTDQAGTDQAGTEPTATGRAATGRAVSGSGAVGGRRPARTSRVATEVIVHVRADGCSLHDGTPIADSVVGGLLDTAFVRALIHDAEGRPVNASVRRRHPTVRQRRVVDERDRCCIDCGGIEFLEYDHQPAYTETGHTHTDELFLRCHRCHTRRHQPDQSP